MSASVASRTGMETQRAASPVLARASAHTVRRSGTSILQEALKGKGETRKHVQLRISIGVRQVPYSYVISKWIILRHGEYMNAKVCGMVICLNILNNNNFIGFKFRRTQPRAICNWSSLRHKPVQFPFSLFLPQKRKINAKWHETLRNALRHENVAAVEILSFLVSVTINAIAPPFGLEVTILCRIS